LILFTYKSQNIIWPEPQ